MLEVQFRVTNLSCLLLNINENARKLAPVENKNTFIDQAMKIDNSCTEGGFFFTVGNKIRLVSLGNKCTGNMDK